MWVCYSVILHCQNNHYTSLLPHPSVYCWGHSLPLTPFLQSQIMYLLNTSLVWTAWGKALISHAERKQNPTMYKNVIFHHCVLYHLIYIYCYLICPKLCIYYNYQLLFYVIYYIIFNYLLSEDPRPKTKFPLFFALRKPNQITNPVWNSFHPTYKTEGNS